MGCIDQLRAQSVAYKAIENDLDEFVESLMKGYVCSQKDSLTHFNDVVWGKMEFEKWEVQIIDSPLFQRLRNVRQLGLARAKFQTASHTRFDHSLGVAWCAKKMLSALRNNEKYNKVESAAKGSQEITLEREHVICLAALLHDIGHGFWSHLSEIVYSSFDEFVQMQSDLEDILNFQGAKPHEILSFVVINTPSFLKFMLNCVEYPHDSKNEAALKKVLEEAGKIIIGCNIEEGNSIYSFMTSIINGKFDADKIDYIKRDGLSSAFSIDYAEDELFQYMAVIRVKDNQGVRADYKLVVLQKGIPALESLTFGRMMLYSYIYTNPVVLVSESLAQDYLWGLWRVKKIAKISDFLKYGDDEILDIVNDTVLASKKPYMKPISKKNYDDITLKELSDKLKNRAYPKVRYKIYPRIEYKPSDETVTKLTELYDRLTTEEIPLSLDEFISEYTKITVRFHKITTNVTVEEFADKRGMNFLDERQAIL
ncbi:MAG: HD domain-containing protein [Oscillospiraceae bacterium]|jgi:HD superfamily phosphohydrolase|nr:HD domain-containing protein [Oscillospiraceae bacterium]